MEISINKKFLYLGSNQRIMALKIKTKSKIYKKKPYLKKRFKLIKYFYFF
jgi:hypothetical protein